MEGAAIKAVSGVAGVLVCGRVKPSMLARVILGKIKTDNGAGSVVLEAGRFGTVCVMICASGAMICGVGACVERVVTTGGAVDVGCVLGVVSKALASVWSLSHGLHLPHKLKQPNHFRSKAGRPPRL